MRDVIVCDRICASKNDVDELLAKLKTTPCPHCNSVGALIEHGFLRGYDQNHQLEKTLPVQNTLCKESLSVFSKNAFLAMFYGFRGWFGGAV
jgi:hypothetical protein